MTDNIIDLDAQKPHTVIDGMESSYLMPTSVLENMASGELKVTEVDGIDDFMPTIIAEWLELTRGY
jgi:hypothetical protein